MERSTVELLKLLLLYYVMYGKEEGIEGLCEAKDNLYEDDYITSDEDDKLEDFISDNEPKNTRTDNFYWEPHKMKPRIKWLSKHIKKLSDK